MQKIPCDKTHGSYGEKVALYLDRMLNALGRKTRLKYVVEYRGEKTSLWRDKERKIYRDYVSGNTGVKTCVLINVVVRNVGKGNKLCTIYIYSVSLGNGEHVTFIVIYDDNRGVLGVYSIPVSGVSALADAEVIADIIDAIVREIYIISGGLR